MEYLNQESVIRLTPKRRVQDCQARDGRKENFPKGRTLPKGWDFFFSVLFTDASTKPGHILDI